MAQGGTGTFRDPDGYAAAFGNASVRLTITGAGDFTARLTRLQLPSLEMFRCYENIARIAYVSLPSERMFLSFPLGANPPIFGRLLVSGGCLILHGRGERLHQRSMGACQWGLLSSSAEQLANFSKVSTGQLIRFPPTSRVLRPSRTEASRFRRLFLEGCRLAETGKELIEYPEVAKAFERAMLHAIIRCLAADEADNSAKTRLHHVAVMVRFEEVLIKHVDQKLDLKTLCAEVGVAERTLRMCCAEFLGVSPTRYALLQRLNRARAELRRADRSTSSVAEVARNHQFFELGRFAVTYRAIFGESPSVTLQRNLQA